MWYKLMKHYGYSKVCEVEADSIEEAIERAKTSDWELFNDEGKDFFQGLSYTYNSEPDYSDDYEEYRTCKYLPLTEEEIS